MAEEQYREVPLLQTLTAQRVPEAQLLLLYLTSLGETSSSIYFAIHVILEAPLNISPAAKATTDIILDLEANHSTKTLSHGINYSNLWSFQRSRWQRKRELRLVSDNHLYSLCWAASSFGWQSSSAAQKFWHLVRVAHVSSSSSRKSPL